MRKHDVRKWLHAVLDLLPVILIPVFMIYSHRHEINDGSIQVQEKVVIDFNQRIKNGNFTSTDNWLGYDSTLTVDNNIIEATPKTTGYPGIRQNKFGGVIGHKYYVTFGYKGYTAVYLNMLGYNGAVGLNLDTTDFNNVSLIFTASTTQNYFVAFNSINFQQPAYFKNFMTIDLTQMYGAGNEPTKSYLDSIYFNQYYDYVLSDKSLIDGDLVIYNDTDIMSQFTYQLYNSVDKYFNMGNVFHLNEVYDWFNLNIFNGQAPIYIFVVYQIVLYELVMDLLFLLYALFMWFIDMIQKLMEKPLNSIK